MPQLVACPSCRFSFQMPESLLGKRLRCASCGKEFTADEERPAEAAPTTLPLRHDPEDDEDNPAPPPLPQVRGLPRHRLPLCPRCHRPVGWHDPYCPHCGNAFEHESPAGIPGSPMRRDTEGHRGALIDRLGTFSMLSVTLGLCVLGPFSVVVALAVGIPTLVMADHDLRKMREHLMDDAGLKATELGRSKALASLVLAVVLALFFVLAIVELYRS
jgi:hypothetical protein